MNRKENGHLEKLAVMIAEVHTDVKWIKEKQKKDDVFREKYEPVLDVVIKKVDEHEVIIQNTKGGIKIAKWVGGVGGLGGLGAFLKSLVD